MTSDPTVHNAYATLKGYVSAQKKKSRYKYDRQTLSLLVERQIPLPKLEKKLRQETVRPRCQTIQKCRVGQIGDAYKYQDPIESDHVRGFVGELPLALTPKLYSPQISIPRVKQCSEDGS